VAFVIVSGGLFGPLWCLVESVRVSCAGSVVVGCYILVQPLRDMLHARDDTVSFLRMVMVASSYYISLILLSRRLRRELQTGILSIHCVLSSCL
jgi:hypothetical protein